MIIDPKQDPMGTAIKDFFTKKKTDKLRVLSADFDEDEIPVPYLFRTFDEMPAIEQRALELARGKVLDVGAGAGSHSLELQKRGLDVTAVDTSTLSCNIMKKRGVKGVLNKDIMDRDWNEKFDTILLMMNGLGMAGSLKKLPPLLRQLKKLLAKGGSIITDMTDLEYIFEENQGAYQMDYMMVYKKISSSPFNWIYLSFDELKNVAQTVKLECRQIISGDNHDYLAVLKIF